LAEFAAGYLRRITTDCSSRRPLTVCLTRLRKYGSFTLGWIDTVQGHVCPATCTLRFDRYVVVRRYGFPSAAPSFEHIGGLHLRLCFVDQNTPALWQRRNVKLVRRPWSSPTELLIFAATASCVIATQAYEMPLVKWRRGNALTVMGSTRLNCRRHRCSATFQVRPIFRQTH